MYLCKLCLITSPGMCYQRSEMCVNNANCSMALPSFPLSCARCVFLGCVQYITHHKINTFLETQPIHTTCVTLQRLRPPSARTQQLTDDDDVFICYDTFTGQTLFLGRIQGYGTFTSCSLPNRSLRIRSNLTSE